MIQATAAQIISQFAGNLRAQLAERHTTAAAPQPIAPPPAAKPISGLSLLARVIWQRIVALFSGHGT
jgi:hypothetical protein